MQAERGEGAELRLREGEVVSGSTPGCLGDGTYGGHEAFRVPSGDAEHVIPAGSPAAVLKLSGRRQVPMQNAWATNMNYMDAQARTCQAWLASRHARGSGTCPNSCQARPLSHMRI